MIKAPDELIPTRRSLLIRLKDWNDQESWKEFFDTYWKLLHGVATNAGLNDAEAQDVVQDTVLSVAKKCRSSNFPTRSSASCRTAGTRRSFVAPKLAPG